MSESDTTRIEQMWFDYDRRQLSAGRQFEQQHPEVEELTLAEEIHNWENWYASNASKLEVIG